MTRKYTFVVEGDSGSYSAYIPELPAILVTGVSSDEVTARAKEAVRLYWDSVSLEPSATATVREIEVDLPA